MYQGAMGEAAKEFKTKMGKECSVTVNETKACI
jgi:hypothetical protein